MSFIIKLEHAVGKSIDEILFEIPDIQRVMSEDNIQSIYNFQDEYYTSHNEYCLNGAISIAIVDSVHYLIDGQHRVKALKLLRAKYPERIIALNIDYFYTTDLDKTYKFVNTHAPNAITTLGIDTYKIINDIEKYMTTNFKQYIKSSKDPHKPNFNIQSLKSYMIDNKIVENTQIKSSAQFIEELIALNNFYGTLDIEVFKMFGVEKVHETLEVIKTNTNKFYLGIYHKFEWVHRILSRIRYNIQYDQMNHYSNSYRPKITKKLRSKVWNCEATKSSCYCCGDEIEYDSFECGHVVPLISGGETTALNLRKICRECNNDMGRMNLEDYKKLITQQLKCDMFAGSEYVAAGKHATDDKHATNSFV
jgi:5-methylcytosine-specific restriction endonuclease McrA